MRRILLALLVVAFASGLRAADPPSKLLTGLFDAQTFAVVRADPARVKVEDLRKNFGDAGPMHYWTKQIEQMQSAKIATLYVLVSTSVNTQMLLLLAIPNDAKDVPAIVETLPKLNESFGFSAKPWGAGVVATDAATWKRIESKETVASPADLDAALAASADAPIAAAGWLPNDLRRILTEMVPNLPSQVGGGPTAEMVRTLRFASASANASGLDLKMTVLFSEANAAKSFTSALEAGRKLALAIPATSDTLKAFNPIVRSAHITTEGAKVSVSLDESLVRDLPVLVTLQQTVERRKTGTNNLRQCALAFHLHHDANKNQFPANICDKDGKPLLSWRVAVLPFVNEKQLYDQFKLDEPWDGPNNKPLLAKMPNVFLAPDQPADATRTTYLGPLGKDYLFVPGAREGLGIRNITDGTSNTIMLVEVPDVLAVEWTKPGDWTPDATDPRKGLFGRHNGGFLAAFADGSVRFISDKIDGPKLKALLTPAGNEIVNDIP